MANNSFLLAMVKTIGVSEKKRKKNPPAKLRLNCCSAAPIPPSTISAPSVLPLSEKKLAPELPVMECRERNGGGMGVLVLRENADVMRKTADAVRADRNHADHKPHVEADASRAGQLLPHPAYCISDCQLV